MNLARKGKGEKMGKINMKILVPLLVILLLMIGGGVWYAVQKNGHDHAGEAGETSQYTCPMHPFILKDKPGSCPICNMDLVKKVAGADITEKDQAALGLVALSPAQRVMANVATVTAEEESISREIAAVGSVQYDQTRQAKVTAWIAGRLDKLYVAAVGAQVAKNKPVAEIYSPELVSTQQEYLLALKSREQFKNSPVPSIAQNGEGLVAAARQRLLLFGVKEEQLAGLEKSGKAEIRLPVYTPLSGTVIEKLVQQGQYVNVGDVLFTIADLSRVWVELDIYDNDIGSVQLGQAVEIRPSAGGARPVTGRVSFIYPFHDPKTHTVRVRVEVPNQGMMFRPDMFVSAVVKSPARRGIVLPVSAVLDSGKRQTVWVEKEPGVFEPREVTVGERSGDKLLILSGLRAGEKVAVSGAYLIDSESQLRGGGAVDHSQHGGSKPAEKPAQKDPLNMDDMKM